MMNKENSVLVDESPRLNTSSPGLVLEDPSEDYYSGGCDFPGMCRSLEDQLNSFTVSACGQPEDLPQPILSVLEQIGVVETVVEVSAYHQHENEQMPTTTNMSENQRLLNKRGMKIDAATAKTSRLNQGAADYATMANKLKQKSKQKNEQAQSRWRPFRKPK